MIARLSFPSALLRRPHFASPKLTTVRAAEVAQRVSMLRTGRRGTTPRARYQLSATG